MVLNRDNPAPGVLRLLLDRAERRNAIDEELVTALERALHAPAEGVVVLGSTDPRAFCAGGDLSLAPDRLHAVSDRLYALYEHVLSMPTVLVAVVTGAAVGAGAQLLLTADLRMAGPDARVSFGGAATGLAIGTWGLPGLIGWGRAMDLCLTGRPVGASEAAAMGLVDRVDSDPMAAAIELAALIAAAPADAVAQVKRLVRSGDGQQVGGVARERAVNAGRTHVDSGTRSGGAAR